MSRTIHSVVAGAPADLDGSTWYESVNPSRTSETIAEVALGGTETFVAGARAAHVAQRDWADVPAPVRGRAIAHIGRVVEENAEALARLVTAEIGKPYAEALGEVREVIDTCDFFPGEGRRLYGQTVPSEMPDKQSACLELGGKNPMVACADADLDLAVEGAVFAGFGTAGQRCTSLGTVIVDHRVHDDFLSRFAEATAAARVGDPESRLFYHPVIVEGVQREDALFLNETFGPIVGVTTFRTLDEAIELANLPGYGLSSAIYTHDPKTVFAFRRGVSAGMVSVNNSTSGAEAHLPFGGNGKSGNGSRQSGIWVLDQMTRWQSVNWDYSGTLQKAQMDVVELASELDFRL